MVYKHPMESTNERKDEMRIQTTAAGEDWSGPYYRVELSCIVHVREHTAKADLARASQSLLAAVREHERSDYSWDNRCWIVLSDNDESRVLGRISIGAEGNAPKHAKVTDS